MDIRVYFIERGNEEISISLWFSLVWGNFLVGYDIIFYLVFSWSSFVIGSVWGGGFGCFVGLDKGRRE